MFVLSVKPLQIILPHWTLAVQIWT